MSAIEGSMDKTGAESSLMEKFKSMFKPKPNKPQEQLRDWQRRLHNECRNIECQIRDVEREEKNVHKAIREATKRNDLSSAKALGKEIVMSRKAVNRLHENKARLNSMSMHLGESLAIARIGGRISKSSEVMKLVNNAMKASEMAVTMHEFSKEMTKAGLIEEVVNDAMDTAMDSEDIEDDIEEEVDKVLSEIAGATTAQLPQTVTKEMTRVPANRHGASNLREEPALAEGADDEEDLEARLAKAGVIDY